MKVGVIAAIFIEILEMNLKSKTMKKKINLNIFILLTVWLIPFFSCRSAAAGELTGKINNPNDIGMVMYSKSSLVGDVVMVVMNDTPVTVISDQVEAEGYRWILVRTQDGHEGWVFATGVTDSNGKLLVPANAAPQAISRTYSGNNSTTITPPGSTGSYGNISGSSNQSYAAQTGAQTQQINSSDNCNIKGNINSEGEKIYHCPGWRDYGKTDIDTWNGERWFCSAAEAEAAGWRAARYNHGACIN